MNAALQMESLRSNDRPHSGQPMTDIEKKAEELYEQSISDYAAAEGCYESVARWNTPAFKDLPESEKQMWLELAK